MRTLPLILTAAAFLVTACEFQPGETVTLRSRMKDSDLPALEALADAILK